MAKTRSSPGLPVTGASEARTNLDLARALRGFEEPEGPDRASELVSLALGHLARRLAVAGVAQADEDPL
jgi:hypothetical protein